jgi:hypothetical protein
VEKEKNCVDYLSINMISNEKSLKYKVVDFTGRNNFYVKFIFIQVHTKMLRFFEGILVPTAVRKGGRDCYSTRGQVGVPTAVLKGGRSPLPFETMVSTQLLFQMIDIGIVLQNFGRSIYFHKFVKNKNKN